MSNPVAMCPPAAADPDPSAPPRVEPATPPLRLLPPPQGLRGTHAIPGAPDAALLALALATLAAGRSEISNLPEEAETAAMAAALRLLGARVTPLAPGHWRVAGRGIGGLVEPAGVLQAGGGTGLGLLAGMLAGHPLFAVLAAGAVPPLGPLVAALSATGARFAARAGHHPPLAVEGAFRALPVEAEVPPGLVAPLLLAGLAARGTSLLRVTAPGPHPAEELLHAFAAPLEATTDGAFRRLALAGQPELSPARLALPAAPEAAAATLVAALLLPGSDLTLPAVPAAPLQGLLHALRSLGADLAVTGASVTARHSPLRGADLAVPPGQLPPLAAAAAFAQGPSRLRGAAAEPGMHDLLALLAAQGTAAHLDGADLLLPGAAPAGPGLLAPPRLPFCGDLTMSMTALVLGLATPGGAILAPDPRLAAALPGLLAAGAA